MYVCPKSVCLCVCMHVCMYANCLKFQGRSKELWKPTQSIARISNKTSKTNEEENLIPNLMRKFVFDPKHLNDKSFLHVIPRSRFCPRLLFMFLSHVVDFVFILFVYFTLSPFVFLPFAFVFLSLVVAILFIFLFTYLVCFCFSSFLFCRHLLFCFFKSCRWVCLFFLFTYVVCFCFSSFRFCRRLLFFKSCRGFCFY